jgi:uncharacterized membrane protein YdjX (TVP38/TMEM64 family)
MTNLARGQISLDKLAILAVLIVMIVASAIIATTGLNGFYSFLFSLGYVGAFTSGLIGTSSLMISLFPPQVVVFILSDPSLGFNPLLIGIAGGIGAGIGQYAHYYIGEGGRYVIPQKYRDRIDAWKPKVEKYGALLIFLFAATPLTPDDLIWIPLGMMKYPKKKALVASIIGKTVMLVAFAYAGYYGLSMFRRRLHL